MLVIALWPPLSQQTRSASFATAATAAARVVQTNARSIAICARASKASDASSTERVKQTQKALATGSRPLTTPTCWARANSGNGAVSSSAVTASCLSL